MLLFRAEESLASPEGFCKLNIVGFRGEGTVRFILIDLLNFSNAFNVKPCLALQRFAGCWMLQTS